MQVYSQSQTQQKSQQKPVAEEGLCRLVNQWRTLLTLWSWTRKTIAIRTQTKRKITRIRKRLLTKLTSLTMQCLPSSESSRQTARKTELSLKLRSSPLTPASKTTKITSGVRGIQTGKRKGIERTRNKTAETAGKTDARTAT